MKPMKHTIPAALVEIDDLSRHLQDTLKRARFPLSPSCVAQLGKIVSHFLRHQLAGHRVIYPGMKEMAKWGGCQERQARKNFSILQAACVILVHDYAKGGRRSTRFSIDFDAIVRLLVTIGTDPSRELISKLRAARDRCGGADGHSKNSIRNPVHYPVHYPALEPVPSAAGIQREIAEPRNVTLTVEKGGRHD